MPGRQSHGRPVTVASGAKKTKAAKVSAKRRQTSQPQGSKARFSRKSLDAFAIAAKEVGDGQKRTPRNRELDAELAVSKRPRHDEDDEDDGSEEPPRKLRRDDDDDVEYGSDSSGHEWRIGAIHDSDDSEIDSDDAFGESDEERFQGYSFGGSLKKVGEHDEDSAADDDDTSSLGPDAIDLSTAWDMASDDEVEQELASKENQHKPAAVAPSPSKAKVSLDDLAIHNKMSDQLSGDENNSEDAESGSEHTDSEDDSSEEDSDDEDDVISDTQQRDLLAKWSGIDDDRLQMTESAAPVKSKLDVNDLSLGTKDDLLKPVRKLLSKEKKSSKPQKVAVPLERRHQAQIDRSVAYEKTSRTLDRWTETVKQNRRADRLVFPLPQTETGLARHNNSEIQPLNQKAPGTELEQIILSIMEQSGLGPNTQKESVQGCADGEEATMSKKQIWQERRRERELKSREEARAKRIKNIKSKTYRRVHRKQKERDELKAQEALAEAGGIDSEEEREKQDRQRAMERMGARHKESKWAKQANKNGRAAWDDNVREGVADMARRNEELRRRVQGKTGREEEDDDSDYSGDSEDIDDRRRMLRELDALDEVVDDHEFGSGLMKMVFMKKAEAVRKQVNDALVTEIRRELASDSGEVDGSDHDTEEVGRRSFGPPPGRLDAAPLASKRAKAKGDVARAFEEVTRASKLNDAVGVSAPKTLQTAPKDTEGAWSSVATAGRRHGKGKGANASTTVLEIDESIVAVARAPKPHTNSQRKKSALPITVDDDSSDDGEGHLPVQFRDQDLLDKAFGGLDVVADFEKEKREQEEADDEKMVDKTLPGWGSWVGDGVSQRQKDRHQGRFLTKQEGIKKAERKDSKLKGVIINEKLVKKNAKYLATQLPHPYESVMQYERALRLPVGPEWVTKETFQDATKPRVLMKQGIIAPMAKPTH